MPEFPPCDYPSVEDWIDEGDSNSRAKINGQAADKDNVSTGDEWLDAFIARHHLAIKYSKPWNGGTKFILKECPFNPEHTGSSAMLTISADGKYGFKCQHDSCEGKKWAQLRAHLEPQTSSYTQSGATNTTAEIRELSMSDLVKLEIPEPKLLIEEMVPTPGACLIVGCSKSGKSLLAMQMAFAVAGGHPLFDYYRILDQGPVLFIEQDDPGAESSVKDIALKSPVPGVHELPFVLIPKLPFVFGDQLTTWLKNKIHRDGFRFVVLDSYTALRASRSSGSDIVKSEHYDLSALDELGKQTDSTILVVHHVSTSKSALNWTEQAAGTFAMAAAVEGQIHISRFTELDSNAAERLIRIRGRHLKGIEFVLRFRQATLDYEHVLDGAAATLYPLIVQIRTHLGSAAFGQKELSHATGVSRATAGRYIDRLYRAGVLSKCSYGEYALLRQYQ